MGAMIPTRPGPDGIGVPVAPLVATGADHVAVAVTGGEAPTRSFTILLEP